MASAHSPMISQKISSTRRVGTKEPQISEKQDAVVGRVRYEGKHTQSNKKARLAHTPAQGHTQKISHLSEPVTLAQGPIGVLPKSDAARRRYNLKVVVMIDWRTSTK